MINFSIITEIPTTAMWAVGLLLFGAIIGAVLNHFFALWRGRQDQQRQAVEKAATERRKAKDAELAEKARVAEAAGLAEAERRKAEAEAAVREAEAARNREAARQTLIQVIGHTLADSKKIDPLSVWTRDHAPIYRAWLDYQRGLDGKRQKEFDAVSVKFHGMIQGIDKSKFAATLVAPEPLGPSMAGRGMLLNYDAGRAELAQALKPILDFAQAG
jgi:hypothetical protein